MRNRLLYGIAIVILAGSITTSVAFYKKSQDYKDEADIFAVGVLDFAKRLHLADDEHPLHFEGGEHPFYEKSSEYQEYYSAYRFYQRGWVASALIGLILALTLIYYASTNPKGNIKGTQNT